MINDFINRLNNENIKYTQETLEKFETYYRLLVEWNHKINLTAITDKEEVYLKHFYDSLCLSKGFLVSNQKILDVGSGAGFPSIPLKILYPELDITIVDSLKKRITFLEHLTKALGIKVNLVHSRIEDYDAKESYDIVTARAVAGLNILCEFCLPFVKLNGYFLPLKSKSVNEELALAEKAIKTLGGKTIDIVDYSYQDLERYIIVIKKVNQTLKKYPRDFSKIKKQPL
jgi:16S rRNA (guanine527-N7)-methyltransferase